MKAYYLDGAYDSFLKDKPKAVGYKSSLNQNNKSCKIISISAEEQQKIHHQAFVDTANFYNKNERYFKEIEDQLGINFWFQSCARVYYVYRNWMLNMASIAEFFKKEKDGILITSNSDLLNYFNKEKIILKKEEVKEKDKTLEKILSELLYIISRPWFLKKPKGKFIIISNITDEVEGKNKRFGSLELELEKMHNRELFDPKKDLSLYKGVSKKIPGSDHLFLNYLLRLGWPSDIFKIKKALNVLRENVFKNHKQDNESSNTRIIFNLFWKNRVSLFIYYFKFRSFDRYFKKYKPKGILLSDENSPQQRAIQYAAKKNGVKVFGFQHGNIHNLHPAYIYQYYHTKPLLPEVTFTWGKHFTNLLLTKGGYKENQVCTCGRITQLNQRSYRNPKISEEDKIILYATQPQREPSVRKQQLKDVLLAAKILHHQYKLIVRPHPNERNDGYFMEIAKEAGFTDFLIDRETDLKTHMDLCALLVTSFSTVGTEFIPYYKPLLVLDYMDQDAVGWIKEGVGIPVRNGQELIKYLKTSNFEINKDLYNRFIENYFFKTDGLAAERAGQIIYSTT